MSSSSWASVACVVRLTAVGLAVAVATVSVVGLVGCLSLVLTWSLLHGVPFQAVLRRGELRCWRDRSYLCVFWWVVGINWCRHPISWLVFLASDTLSVWSRSTGSSGR